MEHNSWFALKKVECYNQIVMTAIHYPLVFHLSFKVRSLSGHELL